MLCTDHELCFQTAMTFVREWGLQPGSQVELQQLSSALHGAAVITRVTETYHGQFAPGHAEVYYRRLDTLQQRPENWLVAMFRSLLP